MAEDDQSSVGHDVGTWCWHARHAAPCRVVDRQDMWGETAYRVWLPTKDAVVRARSQDLAKLDSIQPTVEHILHTAAAAKLLDALEDNLLLAPIQSSVIPLPHQLYALNRAMSQHRIRYLLADEVGLGKTIEAGLILRELKLRGMAKRVLVVAPKGLVRQWQAEMRLHFGEKLQFVDPAELAALAHAHGALVVDDLGSGALLDTAAFGLAHEPTPAERLAAGADLDPSCVLHGILELVPFDTVRLGGLPLQRFE